LETGALTLIQSGFFDAGASGRCAFSGWRALLLASRTTVMEAPELTYGSAASDASGIIACKGDGIGSRFRRDAPVLVVLQ